MAFMPVRATLKRYCEFKSLGAQWKTGILTGFTTFMTMAYIVFVNPAILHETAMPLAAVTAATCLSAAAGRFLMGGFARYPVALASGMGPIPIHPANLLDLPLQPRLNLQLPRPNAKSAVGVLQRHNAVRARRIQSLRVKHVEHVETGAQPHPLF